jgi:tetratricopeptide (TPR) repeat protein
LLPSGRSILSHLLFLVFLTPVALGATSSKEPIVVQDPQYGEVLFYFYQEDYFPALVRLLAARKQEQLTNHADEAELLLGGMYLSYGHHLEAAEIFERLLANNVDGDVRDRTWFFLAKIWYQRGYLVKAREALSYIQNDLPDNLQREALMLDAQILIDAGEYDAAVAKLRNWKGRTEWASYAKFNIGVALVRSGRVDEAAALLNELGVKWTPSTRN